MTNPDLTAAISRLQELSVGPAWRTGSKVPINVYEVTEAGRPVTRRHESDSPPQNGSSFLLILR